MDVAGSNGGVIELGIDVSSLTRDAYSVSTDFGDFAGRSTTALGLNPVHKYLQNGIFVSTSTATNIASGAVAGRARKTLVVSAKETGEAAVGLGVPSSSKIVAKALKGKFAFSGSGKDAVSFTGTITLPSGLDLSKSHTYVLGLGNVIVFTTIDAKGKVTVVSDAAHAFKSLKIKYSAKGGITTGTQTADVTLGYSAAGLLAAGFDTEGISKLSTDTTPGGAAVARLIQSAILLDGVPYESLIPVAFTIDKKDATGSIAGPK